MLIDFSIGWDSSFNYNNHDIMVVFVNIFLTFAMLLCIVVMKIN